MIAQEYPRFSDAEYARRHHALGALLEKYDLDHLLVVTDQRNGNAPQWVTGWPGTVEAFVVFKPGAPMVMHVEWFNHVPLAKRIARDVDVRWGEHRGIVLSIEELKRRGAKRVGLIGPLAFPKRKALEEGFEVVGLDSEYVKMRPIKSDEETMVRTALRATWFRRCKEPPRPAERRARQSRRASIRGQGAQLITSA